MKITIKDLNNRQNYSLDLLWKALYLLKRKF